MTGVQLEEEANQQTQKATRKEGISVLNGWLHLKYSYVEDGHTIRRVSLVMESI